jgi:hypothetical protein
MLLYTTLGFLASALFGTAKGVPDEYIREDGKEDRASASASASEQQQQ